MAIPAFSASSLGLRRALCLALLGSAVASAAVASAEPASTASPQGEAQSTQGGLRVVFSAPQFLIDGGKKTYPTLQTTLQISPERLAELQAKAQETQSENGSDILQRLHKEIKPLLDTIPTTPTNARFEQREGRWKVVQQNGYRLDEKVLLERLSDALAQLQAGDAEANVQIPYETLMPQRTLDFFMLRGITAHLGSGHSGFSGSPDNRVTNIRVSAENFHDRLHSGNFSFLQFIGPVTRARGYVAGLIISGNRTVSGLGGGVCQTSTTAFRALYVAGLPVLERSAHSYKVHYYAPHGLDAAVFEPAPDLRFANDTGGALWFQRDLDEKEGSLSIHVFGKPQNRVVEVSEPRVLSSTPPPPDRFIVDSSLRAGERRQVDWAASGGTTVVERRFIEGGKVVKTEQLRSVYRPWPNIFLVGR